MNAEELIAWLQQFHPKAEVAVMVTDGEKNHTRTRVNLETNGTNPVLVVGIRRPATINREFERALRGE